MSMNYNSISCEEIFESKPNRHLLVQSLKWKYQNNMRDLFKFNYKEDTRKNVKNIVLVFLLLILNRFHTLLCLFQLLTLNK